MMKIPNDETPESHRNGDGYISDDYEQLEMMPAPIRDNDFSEYMWMENEEEFNSQVLRELEEEELMEECLAAMLNDGPSDSPESSAGNQANGSRTSNDSFNSSINGLSESVNILSLSSNGVRNSSENHSQNTPDSSHYRAQSRLERLRTPASESSSNHSNSSAIENGSKSTLNPDAVEFVPLPRTVTNADNIVPS